VKRVFSLALGLGAGLLIGAYVVRRVDTVARSASPTHLAGEAGRSVGGFGERLRHAVEEGRIAAEAREAELRQRYDVPTLQRALER
jgi:hypothetical protein